MSFCSYFMPTSEALSSCATNSWLNTTTPNDITLRSNLDMAYRTQIIANAPATKSLDALSSSETHIISPELVRVGVVRRRTDTDQGGFYNEADSPKDYAKELEVFDCANGFTAYNYTAMYATSNDVTISREQVELLPGTLAGSLADNITFSQDELPNFVASAADVIALNKLFQSPRFTGSMTTSQNPREEASSVVTALLRSDVSQLFENPSASMTDRLRTRADAVAEGGYCGQ